MRVRTVASYTLLICLLSTAAMGEETFPSVTDDPILMAALRYLDAGLQASAPIRTSHLLQHVAQITHRSEADIRHHLLGRLQDLADLNQDRDEGWSTVLESREELSKRQVSRLLDHLGQGLGKILASQDDFLLDTNLRWAARGARTPPEEALQFFSRLVRDQLVNDPLVAAVEPVGVVVNGWTEKYDYKLEPLFIYLDSEDEAAAREAVRDAQRFIVPGVVRGLPTVPSIAWAFRQRDLTSLVDPAYDIRIRVQSMRFKGLTTNLQPCINLGLDVLDTQTGRSVYYEDIDHCTQLGAAAADHRLGPFVAEVANLVVDTLARQLSTLR